MTAVRRVVFLPGAGGDGDFWRPVGAALPADWEKLYLSWPGLGNQPHAAGGVAGLDGLVDRVAQALGPAGGDLVAHSMGGVVAVRVAARHPRRVRRLVLAATSGGVDVGRLGAVDWRADYRREFPGAAAWITGEEPDLTPELRRIAAPTLLLWGDADRISPVAVGEHLLGLLPVARMQMIAGGDHGFPRDQAPAVARVIARHLG